MNFITLAFIEAGILPIKKSPLLNPFAD